MKKYLKILFIMVIALVIPLSVFAKTTINETDIVDIKIPDSWKLITNENLDEMITWLNLNDSQKVSYKYAWNKGSYYFDMMSDIKDKEIILIKKISDFQLEDLSINEDAKIIKKFDTIKKDYEGYELKISLYTTVKGIKYYKVEYKDETLNYNIVDYITTIHGYTYEYKFQTALEINDSILNDIEQIIDSIEYENYLDFVKNNTISTKTKKSSGSSSIVIVFIIILIIGGGLAAYIFLNRKKNNNSNTHIQIYNPVQQNPSNPAVSDFLNQNQERENDKTEQKNEKNNDQ